MSCSFVDTRLTGLAPEHKDVGAAPPCSLRDPYLAVVIYKEKTEREQARGCPTPLPRGGTDRI